MALEEGRFFKGNMTDKRHDADGLAEYCRRFLSSGVWELGDNLKVSVGDGMKVNVNFGAALIDGLPYQLRDNNTGPLQLPDVEPADDQPRIDRVVIRKDPIRLRVYAYIKKGVPSASPLPPALERENGVYEISLAQVFVAAHATEITSEDITDERVISHLNREITKGWYPVLEDWKFVSPNTIRVPASAAARYQIGMPYKLIINNNEKQGYIIDIADSLLTVAGDVLTNHAFTGVYCAPSGVVPLGFKEWFSYIPSLTASGSMTISDLVIYRAEYRMLGNKVDFSLYITCTLGGTAHNTILATLPIQSSQTYCAFKATMNITGPRMEDAMAALINDVTNVSIRRPDASNFLLLPDRTIAVDGSYSI